MFEYIRLKRIMCYGTCPVYSVIVHNEGNVIYNGEIIIKRNGRITSAKVFYTF
jgi:hypothetical protein